MLLSELKKLMQKINPKSSLRFRKPSAATSESEGVSDMENIVESDATEALEQTSYNEPETDDESNDEIERDINAEIDSDIEKLKAIFPELSELGSITELKNPTRYAALRDMGLSVSEAYLATTPRETRSDNRSHLTSSVPRGAKSPGGPMTKQQLNQARAIFGNMSDSEIYNLYKKVTK